MHGLKLKIFQSSTSLQFSIETLIKKVNPVVTENIEFQ